MDKVRNDHSKISWTELLDEAFASNYSYYQLLSRIQGEIHNRKHDNRVDRINLFCDLAREQHQAVYKWFCSNHTSSAGPLDYLGCISADIRGIIGHYLRARVVIGNTTITGIMGVIQSFDDEPAIVKVHANHRNLRWYNDGVMHRIGKPAEILPGRDEILCSWYRKGVNYPNGNCVQLRVTKTSCSGMYEIDDGHCWGIVRDPVLLAHAAELRHEYLR